MRALIIKEGQRFGRLTVAEEVYNGTKHRQFFCRCDCGRGVEVRLSHLTMGKIISCGCYKQEQRTKHGLAGSRVYLRWNSMRQRCDNPNDAGYANYGGRGIKVCERWEKFENFLADMGMPPSPELELDRIDFDRGYEPGNVRWATETVQAINKRKRRNTASQYRGIWKHKPTGKWCASIRVAKQARYLGLHATEEAAARAYDAVARLYKGYRLNFPEGA